MRFLHAEDTFPLLADRQSLAQPTHILLQKRIFEIADDRSECGHGRLVRGESIVDPTPITALLYQAGLGKDFEMARDVRLWLFERIDEFTVTELFAFGGYQEMHQPQADRLAYSFEEFNSISCLHILRFTFIHIKTEVKQEA